uniref:Astacin domain-containing protein n=1 Tax=Strongyloides venezuelensis TaxID=75913 RepID=A0A0K0FFE5_STRVS
MKLSFLITLIWVLYILQNVVESIKLKKLIQRRGASITIIKKPNNKKAGKKPKPKSTTKRKTTSKKTTTSKPSHKPGTSYKSPYYIKQTTIKYYLDHRLLEKFYALIHMQTIHINTLTCLKIERQTNPKDKKDIDIGWCSENWVKLSTTKGTPTKVCLKENTTKNEVLFYFGYALGLVPEITRNDSSLYVTVFENNISPRTDYEKYYEVQQYSSKIIANSSFDYYSMMLSSQYFKSRKNDKRTYRFESNLGKYYEKTANMSDVFNHNDLKRLWYLYCNKKCPSLYCPNYGYPMNNCKGCICPKPISGKKCDELYENPRICGETQEFIANSSKSFYTIKNVKGDCYYLIKSQGNKKVQFIVENLNISSAEDCHRYAGLTVKYREDRGAEGLLLCGNYTNISFPPLTSEIYLMFVGYGRNKLRFSIQEK